MVNEQLQTLVFIKHDHSVLLGLKRRGFGEGKWNGYGGKCNDSENIATCAVRELYEESQLQVDEANLTHLGYIKFLADDHTRKVHIYTAKQNDIKGTPIVTEEMQPQWFDIDHIPYHQMWEDMNYWMHLVLKDRCFEAVFTLNTNDDIVNVNINLINKK